MDSTIDHRAATEVEVEDVDLLVRQRLHPARLHIETVGTVGSSPRDPFEQHARAVRLPANVADTRSSWRRSETPPSGAVARRPALFLPCRADDATRRRHRRAIHTLAHRPGLAVMNDEEEAATVRGELDTRLISSPAGDQGSCRFHEKYRTATESDGVQGRSGDSALAVPATIGREHNRQQPTDAFHRDHGCSLCENYRPARTVT